MNEIQQSELKLLKHFDAFTKKHNLSYTLYAGTMLGAVRHQGFIPWDDDIDVAMKRQEYDRFLDLYLKEQHDDATIFIQCQRTYKYYAFPYAKLRNTDVHIMERASATQKGNLGSWLDVFPYDNIPDNELLRRAQFEAVFAINKKIHNLLLINAGPNESPLRKTVKTAIQIKNELTFQINPQILLLFKKRYEIITQYRNQKTQYVADLSFMYYENYESFIKTRIKNEDFESFESRRFENAEFMTIADTDTVLSTLYGDYMSLPPIEERTAHEIVTLTCD